jgi:uncharacterized caspase-like protein
MKKLLVSAVILLAWCCLFAQERGLEVTRSKEDRRPEPRRIALVIGNGRYEFSPLRNPVTDANDMAQVLISFNFEVITRANLTQNEMKQAIRAFGERIRPGGIGLFYYAGHAVQVEGRNYLIPVGAKITTETEVEDEAVDVGLLLRQMQDAHNQLNIVILDACRTNPFARKFRSLNDGLASINAPSGTLIAYATAPGSVASDGDGKNGLYTQELLKAMREPGLKIEDVFKRVRDRVQNVTRGRQVPWESTSLVGDFYFSGPSTADVQTAKAENKADNKVDYATPVSGSHAPQNEQKTGSDRSPLSLTYAKVFVDEGDRQANQKHWKEAEVEYRQAVELQPNNAGLRIKLGDVLAKQAKSSEAEAEYAEAVRLDPNNKSYRDRLAAARGRKK